MTFYDNSDDHMEVGDLVPVGEGQWIDKETGHTIDEDGKVYDSDGQLIDEGYYDNEEDR